MLNVKKIEALLDEALQGTDLFKVGVNVSPTNVIRIFVDGKEGVRIDDCAKISRYIESHLDREAEDFELQVSSAGLDMPFKVHAQYRKNEGRKVRVVTGEGDVYEGVLAEVSETGVVLVYQEGKKSNRQEIRKELPFDNIKETKVVISFK